MRYSYWLFSILFSFSLLTQTYAQPNLQRLASELKAGDMASIGEQLDAQVELFLGGTDGHFAKADAKQKLQQFFQQNRPISFSVIHKGASRGANAHYCIGKLQTQGQTFRVSIFFREVNGRYLIQEMRAEQD